MLYLGIDGEMTSAELSQGGKLCQIGVATKEGTLFSKVIGWDKGTYQAEPTAMAVHGISESIIESATRGPVVDDELYSWLVAQGADPSVRGRVIPIGFNVAAFDVPFIREALPRSNSLLSRRTIDLNAVVMTMANAGILYNGSAPGWSGWKRLAKRAAVDKLKTMGYEENQHDAGYDALMAIFAWEWLSAAMKSGS